MDAEEFEAWMRVTAASEHRWQLDETTRRNKQGSLAYIGGVDGKFIWIHMDGLLEVGSYEGALPHIGEAAFMVEHSEKFDTYAAAVDWLISQPPPERVITVHVVMIDLSGTPGFSPN